MIKALTSFHYFNVQFISTLTQHLGGGIIWLDITNNLKTGTSLIDEYEGI